jgi:hypothetical protein
VHLPLALIVLSASLFAQNAAKLAPGSKVFISPMNGFEVYLQAAFSKKKVPVSVVLDKEKADLIVSGIWNVSEAGRDSSLFTSANRTVRNYSASVSIVDPKSTVVVFSAAAKTDNQRGDQTEKIAEELADKIKKQAERK